MKEMVKEEGGKGMLTVLVLKKLMFNFKRLFRGNPRKIEAVQESHAEANAKKGGSKVVIKLPHLCRRRYTPISRRYQLLAQENQLNGK